MSCDLDNPGDCRNCQQWASIVKAATTERAGIRAELQRQTSAADLLRADLVDFYREAQGYTEGSPVDVLRQLKQRDEQLSTTRAALAEAERERDEAVSAGKDLVHELEGIARVLNDIGWPSSALGISWRARHALLSLHGQVASLISRPTKEQP